MGYWRAGGDTGDWVADRASGVRLAGVTLAVVDAVTGSVITDLLDAAGDQCAAWVSDAQGQFAGSVPDTCTSYYVRVQDSAGTYDYGPRPPAELVGGVHGRLTTVEALHSSPGTHPVTPLPDGAVSRVKTDPGVQASLDAADGAAQRDGDTYTGGHDFTGGTVSVPDPAADAHPVVMGQSGTTVGVPVVADGLVSTAVRSPWGITAGGVPYLDTDGAATEPAVMGVDPTTGYLTLTSIQV